MAKHLVICRACKERFDAQLSGADIEWVMPSKGWYYHKSCYENLKKGNILKDKDWKNCKCSGTSRRGEGVPLFGLQGKVRGAR